MSKFALKIAVCGLVLAFSLPITAQTSTFTDSRDGKSYRTITIGNRTWMGENLNIETGNSWCYENNMGNCQKYGRLYDWNTAMKACPAEWRLPTRQDWNNLAREVGGNKVDGRNLKSAIGWNSNGNGTNSFGFSALPGGAAHRDGNSIDFDDIGNLGIWWSATENNDLREINAIRRETGMNISAGSLAYARAMNLEDYALEISTVLKSSGFSVRCVRD